MEADPGRRGPPGSGVPEDDDFVGAAGDDADDEEDESDDDDGEEDEEEEEGDRQAPALLRVKSDDTHLLVLPMYCFSLAAV